MDIRIFISHATEDKDNLVRPLARLLETAGFSVWYDEFVLTVGDSLAEAIDKGLRECDYGIVVLSEKFFQKHWPKKELDALISRESEGKKIILPIWHDITKDRVSHYSALLANRIAVTTQYGLDHVLAELNRAITKESKATAKKKKIFKDKREVRICPQCGATEFKNGYLESEFGAVPADTCKKCNWTGFLPYK